MELSDDFKVSAKPTTPESRKATADDLEAFIGLVITGKAKPKDMDIALLTGAVQGLRDADLSLALQPAPIVAPVGIAADTLSCELAAALARVMSWIDNWNPSFTEDAEWAKDDKAAREALKRSVQPVQPTPSFAGLLAKVLGYQDRFQAEGTSLAKSLYHDVTPPVVDASDWIQAAIRNLQVLTRAHGIGAPAIDQTPKDAA